MTTRRQFIRGVVAVGVAATLPSAMADATSLFSHDGTDQAIKFVNGFNYVGVGSVGNTWEGGGGFASVLGPYTEAERIAARVTSLLEYKFTKFFNEDEK